MPRTRRARPGAVGVGGQEADAPLHPQEAPGGHREQLRGQLLHRRVVEAEDLDQGVEDAHEVVARVVQGLAGHGQGIVEDVLALLGREAQRVLEHVDEVVLHQQGLVLVHGQARVALRRLEGDVDPALLDPGSGQQIVHPVHETGARDRPG